jgi:hypothetical protein
MNLKCILKYLPKRPFESQNIPELNNLGWNEAAFYCSTPRYNQTHGFC